MIWLLVMALAVVVILLIALYRRALNDTRDMFSLLILVLLEDSVRTARKTDLVNFVTGSKAANASQLSTEVFTSVSKVANRLARTSVLGAHAALWQLKNGGGATG
jgi:hypothetical protein